jgi:hypothetical protein
VAKQSPNVVEPYGDEAVADKDNAYHPSGISAGREGHFIGTFTHAKMRTESCPRSNNNTFKRGINKMKIRIAQKFYNGGVIHSKASTGELIQLMMGACLTNDGNIVCLICGKPNECCECGREREE